MKSIAPICLFSLLLLLLAGCATVPYTGRSRLALIPESEVLSMSRSTYRQFIADADLSRDSAQNETLLRVGRRVAAAAEAFLRDEGLAGEIKNYEWEVRLIENDKEVNAWCMPGGKIAVYTGILPYTKDEAGLAVVIGHEVAHALAHHGSERMSQALLVQLGGIGLSQAVRKEPDKTRALWYAAYGLGSRIGFILPYSRLQEYEADQIGLILTARAGYDPWEALDFWKRMMSKGRSRQIEFLSTHPADEERLQAIREMMPEALRYYRE